MIRVYPSTLEGVVDAPPSKSYTHRAIAISMMTHGRSSIENPLISDDTIASLRAAQLLGAEIHKKPMLIEVDGGVFRTPDDVIDVGNSGTTLRFFTAIAGHTPGGYTVLTGDESIRRRPMGPLLKALRMLGVECWSTRMNDLAPVVVRGGGIRGGEAEIEGNVSSQFISALLIASPKTDDGVEINVLGEPVSRPYIDATITVMERFGFRVSRDDHTWFGVEGGQEGKPTWFRVPGDYSSASFLLAAAYLTSGDITVKNLDPKLPQADMKILDVVRLFGGLVKQEGESVRVRGEAQGSRDIEINLRDSPDLLPIVAMLAAKNPGRTLIKGVEHAHYKETDRVRAVAEELRKLGIQVEETGDGLLIYGKREIEGGIILDPHRDHRLFMALTVISLATRKGCLVEGEEWASVSYPQFLEHLEILGARIESSL